MYMAWIILCKN